tara:strand:+ start:680 stop:955 length:276 start_codon:yes stop_codon:yes gene_type:complete
MSQNVVIAKESDSATSASETQQQPQQQQSQQQQVNLVDVPITNENVSLNVMVGFLNTAQKRGVFNVQESAKIWECIRIFQKPSGPQGPENM